MSFWNHYSRAIWYYTTSYLSDSFADADFWVDRLYCDYNILFFESAHVPKPKPINDNNITTVNGGFHGYSIGIADCEYMFFNNIISGYNGYNSEIIEYVLPPHLVLFINFHYGNISD